MSKVKAYRGQVLGYRGVSVIAAKTSGKARYELKLDVDEAWQGDIHFKELKVWRVNDLDTMIPPYLRTRREYQSFSNWLVNNGYDVSFDDGSVTMRRLGL